jgi:hypothetical protein
VRPAGGCERVAQAGDAGGDEGAARALGEGLGRAVREQAPIAANAKLSVLLADGQSVGIPAPGRYTIKLTIVVVAGCAKV